MKCGLSLASLPHHKIKFVSKLLRTSLFSVMLCKKYKRANCYKRQPEQNELIWVYYKEYQEKSHFILIWPGTAYNKNSKTLYFTAPY